jgi:hypothetical protein
MPDSTNRQVLRRVSTADDLADRPHPMTELESSADLRYQVLADPTGRRRRRMAIAGRGATIALGLWLLVLMLGGLGLQPLAGLPIVGDLGSGDASPPSLPERVQTALDLRTTLAPARRTESAPAATVPVTPRRPAGTAGQRAAPRAQLPARRRRPRAPSPMYTGGRGPGTSTPATNAPASAGTRPGREPAVPAARRPDPSTSAPGQLRIPSDQVKPEPAAPAGTPGGAAGAKGGSAPSASEDRSSP